MTTTVSSDQNKSVSCDMLTGSVVLSQSNVFFFFNKSESCASGEQHNII